MKVNFLTKNIVAYSIAITLMVLVYKFKNKSALAGPRERLMHVRATVWDSKKKLKKLYKLQTPVKSGGALMCTDQKGDSILSGIISTGFQCALPRIPGLYTRLSHYSSWMKQIINAHPNVDMVNIDFRDFLIVSL